MPGAWGGSWAKSWGGSFGAIVEIIRPSVVDKGGHRLGGKWSSPDSPATIKPRRDRDDDLLILLL